MAIFRLLIAALLLGPSLLHAEQTPMPEKALCAVCAVKDGETEFEKVKAHSEYQGKTYYFCAKHCKEEFDLDPTGYLPPKLPRPAPTMVVETLEGKSVALQDYKGKLVLLDFWATWCKPCVKMMPQLQKLHAAYADKGLVVMGVSIDDDKNPIKKIKKFVDKVDVSYPIFLDAKQTPAWHLFKVKAIPALFLVDQQGQIVAQWTGDIDHKQVKAEITGRLVSQEAMQKEPAAKP